MDRDITKCSHLPFTRDNTSIKLYVDGILSNNNSPNTATNGTSPGYQVPSNFVLGSRVDANGYFQFIRGSPDDLHLYNRAINSEEVKTIYDGNIPQAITITSNIEVPCGGDNITFTANGGSVTSKYQWKMNDVNAVTQTASNTFTIMLPINQRIIKSEVYGGNYGGRNLFPQ